MKKTEDEIKRAFEILKGHQKMVQKNLGIQQSMGFINDESAAEAVMIDVVIKYFEWMISGNDEIEKLLLEIIAKDDRLKTIIRRYEDTTGVNDMFR